MASAPSSATAQTVRKRSRWRRRAQITARRINLFFWLELAAYVALAVMLATAWVALGVRSDKGEPIPSAQAAALLVSTLIPALAIVVLWGRRVAIRRAGTTTARLHVNLVFFFSLLAAIPTLMVAVFASFLFQSGVQFWFSSDSRGILENANELARESYDANQRNVRDNAIAMANDVRAFLNEFPINSSDFQEQYLLQTYYRDLSKSAILVVGEDGVLRTPAIVAPDQGDVSQLVSADTIARIRGGEDVVVKSYPESIDAVTALDQDATVFLYISRRANASYLRQYQLAQDVVSNYDELSANARVLQLRFNIALFFVSLALVGLAVYAALRFADRQVKPLAELAGAAREIGAGNYAMRVSGRAGQDEIGLLNRAFNRMTAQIERQTDALLGANHQLAERRTFIEAVLQSITAGIISVDGEGRVSLMNNSARAVLLDDPEAVVVGTDLHDIAPQLSRLVEEGAPSEIIQLNRGNELLTLAVQMAPATEGHVITFEDITRRLLDQRQAAWSDVARRIAHEIKNPLTPIQLATERLKRRYGRQIDKDVELFEELTGTIIRQVGDLRKMVDEFSSFARIPKPHFRSEDAVDLLRQALFLQEVAHPDIAYRFEAESEIGPVECDRHQFGQAMTNVLKNAAEAIEARRRDAPEDWRGRIGVTVSRTGRMMRIDVKDNGIGLPKGTVNVIEPYVTTREKGTGLGLAIVKKIVEEHGGDIAFTSPPGGGTCATLRFAIDPAEAGETSEAAE
ncbi:sensor histidine kinase [Aurantiacibacter spongiae]|uniref:histidine kinase n=1 Tax=Aurantiacibacter spongiae TaxID=2488860 RepID=A0A3N5CNV0_9SPHN|nr:ATP-binding protein [Aurantiacibacter spongiae]RPF70257.1 HAMP domain-containing protein [Aurantiacibacter spongiae]